MRTRHLLDVPAASAAAMRVLAARAARAAALAAALAVPAAAAAHHAFVAQYDADRPVSLTGVVTKIEWLNPHAYFFIDVEGEEPGSVTTWAAEMGSPVVLMRRGWTRNSMKIGDVVAVDGIAARDGSPSLNAQSVVLTSTGRKLFTRSADEERSVAESDAASEERDAAPDETDAGTRD